MISPTRWLAAAATVLAAAATVATIPAQATSLPWQPDPNALAGSTGLEFFNSAGVPVTSGTNLSHLFDYVLAPVSAIPAGATRATIYFAAPHSGLPTGNWFASQESAASVFPSTTAAAPLAFGQSPLDTLQAADADLSTFLQSAQLDTTPGYAGYIQIRLKYTGPGGVTSGNSYYEADISYNATAGTWSEVYPGAATTTTTALSAPSTAAPGANVTLTATVPSAAAGSVTFVSNGTALGTAAVTAGTASLTTSFASAGSYPVDAVFSPSTTSFLPSQSTTSTITVSSTPPPTVTKATTMTGTFKVGTTATCKQGTFSGTGLTYATAWYSGGVLTSDTSSTYPIGVSDYKKTLYCAVTATNAGGSATSAAVAKTVAAGAAPTPSNTPVITGTLAVGQTLALTTVTSWSGGLTPTKVSYKWERAGVAITGATKSTYKLVTADSGQSITCVITYAFTGYASKIITTAPVIG